MNSLFPFYVLNSIITIIIISHKQHTHTHTTFFAFYKYHRARSLLCRTFAPERGFPQNAPEAHSACIFHCFYNRQPSTPNSFHDALPDLWSQIRICDPFLSVPESFPHPQIGHRVCRDWASHLVQPTSNRSKRRLLAQPPGNNPRGTSEEPCG